VISRTFVLSARLICTTDHHGNNEARMAWILYY